MDDTLVLWMLAGLTVGIVAGQLLIIVFDNYQSYKTRKRIDAAIADKTTGGGSLAFSIYRDLAKAERERGLKTHDKTS